MILHQPCIILVEQGGRHRAKAKLDALVLLGDALSYVARAVDAGVDARVDVWQGMPHGFASGVGKLAAANQALASIGAFLARRLDASIG